MKRLILLLCLTTIITETYASKPLDEYCHNFSMGAVLAIGPENAFAVIPPKLNFNYYNSHPKFETYVGVDLAASYLFAFIYSVGVLGGIKKNVFTFDTSIAYWSFPAQNTLEGFANSSSRISLNPKIGIKYHWLWLKVGPSIIINERRTDFNYNFSFPNLNDWENYNFELGFHFPLKLANQKKIDKFNNRTL